MRKKVFIITPTLYIGGGQKLVIDLAKNISKTNFNLKIICLFPKSNSIFEKILTRENIEVIYMDKRLGFDFNIIFKLIKLFRKEKPEIIHTHLNVVHYVLPATIINKVKKRIHTVHSIAEKEAEGIQRKIMRISYKYLNFIPVAICDYVKESINILYKIDETKIPCIYNGVDIEKFSLNCSIEKDPTYVNFITTGRLEEVKNHKLMIDAFNDACKITPNIKLTILGDGKLMNDLKRQIEKYNIGDKVLTKGNVENVGKELAKSDVYIMTSDYEGLPLSILEAMSCSLPIISTRAGGVIDIVKDDENGMLVEVGNKEQLVDAIIKSAMNKDIRAKQGNKSFELVKQYNIKNICNEYEKLYLSDYN